MPDARCQIHTPLPPQMSLVLKGEELVVLRESKTSLRQFAVAIDTPHQHSSRGCKGLTVRACWIAAVRSASPSIFIEISVKFKTSSPNRAVRILLLLSGANLLRWHRAAWHDGPLSVTSNPYISLLVSDAYPSSGHGTHWSCRSRTIYVLSPLCAACLDELAIFFHYELTGS